MTAEHRSYRWGDDEELFRHFTDPERKPDTRGTDATLYDLARYTSEDIRRHDHDRRAARLKKLSLGRFNRYAIAFLVGVAVACTVRAAFGHPYAMVLAFAFAVGAVGYYLIGKDGPVTARFEAEAQAAEAEEEDQ